MRGTDQRSGSLFSYVDIEARVPKEHPLRGVRELVNGALSKLDKRFGELYSKDGRPSIAPRATAARQPVAAVLFDPVGAAAHGANGFAIFCFAGL